MHHQYLILNDKIIPANEPAFFSSNRALRYGDGLFEGMRILNGEFIFFEDHFSRLIKGMQTLGFTIPAHFAPTYFYKKITDLLIANKATSEAIIRIQVYRSGAGLYEPITDGVEFFIETFDTVNGSFKWPVDGISVGLFTDWKKEMNPAMNFKTCNSQIYIMASRFKHDNGFDDVLLINSTDNIADATSSNVFIWKENKLITPALSEACIAGVIRKNLLATAVQNSISIEEKSVTEADVLNADELFLTNVSRGIRPVISYKNKQYKTRLTSKIAELFYSQF